MMIDRVCTMTKEQMKAEKRKRFIADIKWSIYMFAHKVFWRFLWFTKLATPYSKWDCKNNLYRKFPDGRCHWCGEVH